MLYRCCGKDVVVVYTFGDITPMSRNTDSGFQSVYSEHAPIRFRAWGSAPPRILKLGTSGVAKFLICAFFLLLLKDPDTQMTCNTPKIWPHFGCNKHIFRLFSSLLFYFAQRHRGTSCLGSDGTRGEGIIIKRI